MANEKIVNRENLKAFRQAYDTRLENGSLVPEKSQTAKNLLPVSSASGSTQTAPFINQGTATNNNDSQAEVDTGTLGQHLEKQGNTVVVNQITPTITGDTYSSTNSADYDATSILSNVYDTNLTDTWLFIAKVSDITANCKARIRFPLLTDDLQKGNNYFIRTSINNANLRLQYKSTDGNNASVTVDNDWFKSINLTQWFNGDIPQDLLDNPSHFSWYYNGDLSYNAGELVNSNGRYLVNGGQNVWNEEWELGGINVSTGINEPSTTQIRSKDNIQVIPNRQYYFYGANQYDRVYFYDKNNSFIYMQTVSNPVFTTPSNCAYIRFMMRASYGTTYNNDVTISLYYAGEDYSQYVPYEEPKVYDTGDEVLRQAGSVCDYKEPNGTITRKVGVVKVSDLSWNINSARALSSAITPNVKIIAQAETPNILCNGLIPHKQSDYTSYDNVICTSYDSSAILIRDTSVLTDQATFLAKYGNYYIYYELATQTTEQGTPFSENMDINDMGNMAWYSAYTDENTNTPVQVPQGCKIFYPAWYVGFIDSLGQRADIEWSADSVVSKSELSASETQRDTIDTQLKNAIGGTLRQLLASSQSVDFLNTDFVDLGTLSWSHIASGSAAWETSSLNTIIKNATSNSVAGNIICSISKNVARNDIAISTIAVSIDGKITIAIDGTQNYNVSQFTNSIKGVLLAYEKA